MARGLRIHLAGDLEGVAVVVMEAEADLEESGRGIETLHLCLAMSVFFCSGEAC